jgi:type II secretory pathway pseudopilin PulG
VVVAIIGALLAVLMPAVHRAREKSRQHLCMNNLKNIGLGLQNYHDTYRMFPMGAMHSGENPGGEPPVTAALGPSWWCSILPFMESTNYYDRIMNSQRPGGPKRPQFCADDMNAHLASWSVDPVKTKRPPRTLSSWTIDYLRCPSSPLPTMETSAGPICLPSYVGIAGGCDIAPDSPDYRPVSGPAPPGLVPPQTNRVYRNLAKGIGATPGGIVTSSGMLPPCQQLSYNDCRDGTANTLIAAEQSDWLRDLNAKIKTRYHGDPGWTVGGTGPGGGWLSGTRRVDPVPLLETPGGPPKPWGADCWNITTVRYRPNLKCVLGKTPLPGCNENHGINNPLQSPHPGELLAVFVDGSVQFISETTDFAVLLRIAIRDDGQTMHFD